MSQIKQKTPLIHLENSIPVSSSLLSTHFPLLTMTMDLTVVTLHYDGDDYHSEELYLRDHHRTAIAEA